MDSALRAARQPQPRSHTLPTGQEIGYMHTSQMRGYYCFCVCTIKSSLWATNNGNFFQAPVTGSDCQY